MNLWCFHVVHTACLKWQPTFLFTFLRMEKGRQTEKEADKFSPSFCLPFEITLRCHERCLPPSSRLSPLPSHLFQFLPNFAGGARIFLEAKEGDRQGGRVKEGPSRKKEKRRWNLHFFLTTSPPPQRQRLVVTVTDSNKQHSWRQGCKNLR